MLICKIAMLFIKEVHEFSNIKDGTLKTVNLIVMGITASIVKYIL